MTGRFAGRTVETPCTVEIEHTHDAFHAHVVLDGDIEIGPGDKVQVHGAPIAPRFGDRFSERRLATVRHAGLPLRLWTRLTARFAVTELYEVSFTTSRRL